MNKKYDFEFSLSFAGEEREIVEKIAKKLEDKGIKIFYDNFYKAELLGKDLAKKFKEIYGEKSEYVVIFVSKNYEKKLWTNFEFEIARKAIESKKEDYILPIKFDDTILFGLKDTIAYIDFNKEDVDGTVEILCNKLALSDDKNRAKLVERFFYILNEVDRLLNWLLDSDYGREYSNDINGVLLRLAEEGWIGDHLEYIKLKDRQKRFYIKGLVPSINQLKQDVIYLEGLNSDIISFMEIDSMVNDR